MRIVYAMNVDESKKPKIQYVTYLKRTKKKKDQSKVSNISLRSSPIFMSHDLILSTRIIPIKQK